MLLVVHSGGSERDSTTRREGGGGRRNGEGPDHPFTHAKWNEQSIAQLYGDIACPSAFLGLAVDHVHIGMPKFHVTRINRHAIIAGGIGGRRRLPYRLVVITGEADSLIVLPGVAVILPGRRQIPGNRGAHHAGGALKHANIHTQGRKNRR